MANRVIPQEVKQIIDTSLTDPRIETFISSANAVVTDLLSGAGYTEEKLKTVELWLTAHFIASTVERQIKAEQTGQARVDYEGRTWKGLDGTTYGQQVMLLDTSGMLVQRIGKRIASMYAITSFEYED